MKERDFQLGRALRPGVERVVGLHDFDHLGAGVQGDLGDAEHGFPYLSGRGRLVVKDAIMLGAALVTMADSAKTYLRKREVSSAQQIAV